MIGSSTTYYIVGENLFVLVVFWAGYVGVRRLGCETRTASGEGAAPSSISTSSPLAE